MSGLVGRFSLVIIDLSIPLLSLQTSHWVELADKVESAPKLPPEACDVILSVEIILNDTEDTSPAEDKSHVLAKVRNRGNNKG